MSYNFKGIVIYNCTYWNKNTRMDITYNDHIPKIWFSGYATSKIHIQKRQNLMFILRESNSKY